MAKRAKATKKDEHTAVVQSTARQFEAAIKKLGMSLEWELKAIKEIVDSPDTKPKEKIEALTRLEIVRAKAFEWKQPVAAPVPRKPPKDDPPQLPANGSATRIEHWRFGAPDYQGYTVPPVAIHPSPPVGVLQQAGIQDAEIGNSGNNHGNPQPGHLPAGLGQGPLQQDHAARDQGQG